MKQYNNWTHEYEFCCDKCGKLAGSDADEQKARELARKVSYMQEWEWKHPGWACFALIVNSPISPIERIL